MAKGKKTTRAKKKMPSPLNEAEKALTDLALGVRTPETEDEKELAADIASIKQKGRKVEIPNEIA